MYVFIKDDFQSILHILRSLFAFFVLLHVRHHTYLKHVHEVNSKFQNNHHYGGEVVEALCFVLSQVT